MTPHSPSALRAETVYVVDRSRAADVLIHLLACDSRFVPPLAGRVDLHAYAQKLARHASRSEAWDRGTLVGLVAIYANDPERRIAHVTSVSVLESHSGQGIAARLLRQAMAQAGTFGMQHATLEVALANTPAIRLYEAIGFSRKTTQSDSATWCTMEFDLTPTTARRAPR